MKERLWLSHRMSFPFKGKLVILYCAIQSIPDLCILRQESYNKPEMLSTSLDKQFKPNFRISEWEWTIQENKVVKLDYLAMTSHELGNKT